MTRTTHQTTKTSPSVISRIINQDIGYMPVQVLGTRQGVHVSRGTGDEVIVMVWIISDKTRARVVADVTAGLAAKGYAVTTPTNPDDETVRFEVTKQQGRDTSEFRSHLGAEGVRALAAQLGGPQPAKPVRVVVDLPTARDTAWNPTSTKGSPANDLAGPATVTYAFYADGGIDTHVHDLGAVPATITIPG